jgi:signal transduction histidine kinase
MTTMAHPVDLGVRSRLTAAGGALLFLLASVPLGAAYLVCLPVALLAGAGTVRGLFELTRRLANRLLRAHIPALPPAAAMSQLERHQIWFMATRLPLTLAIGALCALPIALLIELLILSARGLAGSSAYLGPWSLGPAIGIVLLLLVGPAILLTVAVAGAARPVLARSVRHGLASRSASPVPVREALARRLGDRTLAIAYWLPEREIFVDERGLPVALPEPGSGRAWTAVEHDGTRVAAIIHDAELDARPELVEAAAAGAVLALDNERLKADLRARLEELRASRRRIVEASGEARRQLERDLHDGAQQRLVSVSLDLKLLRAKISDPAISQMVEATAAELSEALTELRELARGIHPAILTDRGLVPALEVLAGRSPVQVELDLQVPTRLPIAVETAAYFVAAEGLTNVAKYSQATHVRVSVKDRDGVLALEVADDGIGGADLNKGTGLRGLEDRVAAIDGHLTLDSPLGGGTRLHLVIPHGEVGR